MSRILIFIIGTIIPLFSFAEELKALKNEELAVLLGLSRIIYSGNYLNDGLPYDVRIIASPTRIGECWGTIKSCPDERLLITASTGDLDSVPAIYELPVSKGWEFVELIGTRKNKEGNLVGVKLKTTIPGSNIEQEERERWNISVYTVWFSDVSGTYEQN